MKTILNPVGIFSTLIALIGCSTVPLTGRQQLDLVPSSTMMSMSYQNYSEFIKSNKLSSDKNQAKIVKTVGEKIQHAVERYMADNHLSHLLEGYNWEFNLVDGKEMNAWCMPGGKVVVYTGILPVTKDENGLAVVMGHEIAHAIARHGDERMSQGMLVQFGGIALSTAIASKPKETQQLWMTAFGVGSQVGVMLPYSRLHESEADRLGLIFMAMAGYDPNTAVEFWERMSRLQGGQKPPELLSTHPSDDTRIRKIREELQEAMGYYRK